MGRRVRRINDEDALAVINQVWTEAGEIEASVLRERIIATGDDRALLNLTSLKNQRQIVGRIIFDNETGTISHVYSRPEVE